MNDLPLPMCLEIWALYMDLECYNYSHFKSGFSSKCPLSMTKIHNKIVRKQNIPNFVSIIDIWMN